MEEEIKEITEEKLDSPLVVHKPNDASYQETANDVDMNTTHTDEDEDMPTLERHRFRKEKKSKKNGVWIFLCLLAVAVAVFCGLLQSGKINLKKPEPTTKVERTYTTEKVNEFEGKITVKGTYIFFEGEEIDGIKELEREVKYLDKGASFVVQDENADSNFLNFEVLGTLTEYGIGYEVEHIYSSGLKSKYETTTTTTTTTKAVKKAPVKSSKKA